MIEIIEKGPEKFFVTCQKCGAKLSYELEDVREYFGGSGKIYCPICRESCYHYISEKEYTTTTNTLPTSGYVVVDDTVSTSISKEELEDKYKELKDKVHRDKVNGDISLHPPCNTCDNYLDACKAYDQGDSCPNNLHYIPDKSKFMG